MFVAGDTCHWTRVVDRYPISDGWALHYRFVGPSTFVTDPVVTAQTSYYDVVLAASATAAADFIAGEYRLIGYVDGVNSERHTIFDGIVEIQANVAVASYSSMLTHDERMLTAIQARLEGRVTTDVARYGREGTFVDKLPIEELMRMQGIYQAKVWRQQNAGQSFVQHEVRFGPENDSGISDDAALAWPGLPQ